MEENKYVLVGVPQGKEKLIENLINGLGGDIRPFAGDQNPLDVVEIEQLKERNEALQEAIKAAVNTSNEQQLEVLKSDNQILINELQDVKVQRDKWEQQYKNVLIEEVNAGTLLHTCLAALKDKLNDSDYVEFIKEHINGQLSDSQIEVYELEDLLKLPEQRYKVVKAKVVKHTYATIPILIPDVGNDENEQAVEDMLDTWTDLDDLVEDYKDESECDGGYEVEYEKISSESMSLTREQVLDQYQTEDIANSNDYAIVHSGGRIGEE